VLALAALLGCSGKPAEPPGVPRLLITHTENLSGNPSLDGVARAISHLVRAQLSGSAALAVFEAGDATEAASRRASRIVRSWLELRGDRLSLHVNVRSAEGKTLEQCESSALAAEGPSPLGPEVLMGPDFKQRLGNAVASLEAGLIAPVQIIAVA